MFLKWITLTFRDVKHFSFLVVHVHFKLFYETLLEEKWWYPTRCVVTKIADETTLLQNREIMKIGLWTATQTDNGLWTQRWSCKLKAICWRTLHFFFRSGSGKMLCVQRRNIFFFCFILMRFFSIKIVYLLLLLLTILCYVYWFSFVLLLFLYFCTEMSNIVLLFCFDLKHRS